MRCLIHSTLLKVLDDALAEINIRQLNLDRLDDLADAILRDGRLQIIEED